MSTSAPPSALSAVAAATLDPRNPAPHIAKSPFDTSLSAEQSATSALTAAVTTAQPHNSASISGGLHDISGEKSSFQERTGQGHVGGASHVLQGELQEREIQRLGILTRLSSMLLQHVSPPVQLTQNTQPLQPQTATLVPGKGMPAAEVNLDLGLSPTAVSAASGVQDNGVLQGGATAMSGLGEVGIQTGNSAGSEQLLPSSQSTPHSGEEGQHTRTEKKRKRQQLTQQLLKQQLEQLQAQPRRVLPIQVQLQELQRLQQQEQRKQLQEHEQWKQLQRLRQQEQKKQKQQLVSSVLDGQEQSEAQGQVILASTVIGVAHAANCVAAAVSSSITTNIRPTKTRSLAEIIALAPTIKRSQTLPQAVSHSKLSIPSSQNPLQNQPASEIIAPTIKHTTTMLATLPPANALMSLCQTPPTKQPASKHSKASSNPKQANPPAAVSGSVFAAALQSLLSAQAKSQAGIPVRPSRVVRPGLSAALHAVAAHTLALQAVAPNAVATYDVAMPAVALQAVAPQAAATHDVASNSVAQQATEAPPRAIAEQDVATQAVASKAVARQAVAPQGAAGQDVATQAVAPKAVARQDVAPQPVAPQGVAGQAVARQDVAPQPVAPQGVAGQAVAQPAVAPRAVARRVVAPQAVAPHAVVRQASATQAAAQQALAPQVVVRRAVSRQAVALVSSRVSALPPFSNFLQTDQLNLSSMRETC